MKLAGRQVLKAAYNPVEATVQSERFISPGINFGAGKVSLLTEHVIPLLCIWLSDELVRTQTGSL